MRFRDPKASGERIKGWRAVREPEAGGNGWERGATGKRAGAPHGSGYSWGWAGDRNPAVEGRMGC